jgi:TonB family protein
MVGQHVLVILATVAIIPSHYEAQGERTYATKWDYFVVSTPDFLGPFRGNDSTFRAPVPTDVAKPAVESSRKGEIGLLEVIVSSDGSTKVERMLRSSGSRSGKAIREVVNRWRFEPARLNGRAIRVRLRVTVSNHNP